MKRRLLLLLIPALAAAAQPALDHCRLLTHHGQARAAQTCYTSLTRSSDSFLRAEGFFGLGLFDDANNAFRAAYKAQPRSSEVKAEWGRLYLEHYQPADAAKLFTEAVETDPNDAPAYLGLAKVFAQRFDKRAVDLTREALKHDPKLVAGHELLAYLALEDNDPKLATSEAQQALNLSSEALDAMAVLASIDWLNDKPELPMQSAWIDRILKVNPADGDAYATGAHFLEINYRYQDAIAFLRKAVALNPELWSARSDLGVNLMRLGRQEEARDELQRCYAAHYRSPETVNSLRLLDTLGDYELFKTADAELLLNKKEAALLRPYIQPELERAIATYRKKYNFSLPGPVRVEVYPNHDDFTVRTLGLPGQGGLLGVTFGLVVTMDSPSARPPGQFNWGSTMWHELSHVYILTATHHLVPRWFTEGLAVHEEGAAAPDWSSRLTPEIVVALQKKQILPVLDLDRGFVRPEFPSQVLVSYYEAGRICDFIAQKWGDSALLGIVHSYAARKSTAEAITENLHESPAAFDKDFASWLDKETGSTVRHFDEWRKGLQAAHASFTAGQTDEAIRQGLELRDEYREYVGPDNVYELLAAAYTKKNNNSSAQDELLRYRNQGGTQVDMLTHLAHLEADSGKPKEAEATLAKLNFIYPESDDVHRLHARLDLTTGDTEDAVRESEALLAVNPGDVVETHFQLAQALHAAHRLPEAKEQVVLSLEAAPDYKPAQHLLLELSQ